MNEKFKNERPAQCENMKSPQFCWSAGSMCWRREHDATRISHGLEKNLPSVPQIWLEPPYSTS